LEHAESLHERAIARHELRKYPTGAPACLLHPAKKGESGLK
jgi:hypothetical protein